MSPSLFRLRPKSRKWRVRFQIKRKPVRPSTTKELLQGPVPFASSNFGRLPPELKNVIYELVLLTIEEVNHSEYADGFLDEDLQWIDRAAGVPKPPSRVSGLSMQPSLYARVPALLQTCQQMRSDTLSMYYSRPFIVPTAHNPWRLARHIRSIPTISLRMVERLTYLTPFCRQCNRHRVDSHYFNFHLHSGRCPYVVGYKDAGNLVFLLVKRGVERDRLCMATSTAFPLTKLEMGWQMFHERIMDEHITEGYQARQLEDQDYTVKAEAVSRDV